MAQTDKSERRPQRPFEPSRGKHKHNGYFCYPILYQFPHIDCHAEEMQQFHTAYLNKCPKWRSEPLNLVQTPLAKSIENGGDRESDKFVIKRRTNERAAGIG
ncbi:MAG: hypothetical protein HY913_10530 [Desulfomonile tiedjei]|nr:hypothetical protein [Desulfomonile tiedjei]